ncbi:ferredoxin [Mycolicibacterium thermoresistibile]
MAERLIIDRDTCAGHGLCYGNAPDIMDCDEQGDPVLLLDPIPDELIDRAKHIVNICPERALSLRSD